MKLKKFIAILSVARVKATGILQMISQLFQEKMVQEQEEHSLNFSGLKKRKTAKKLI